MASGTCVLPVWVVGWRGVAGAGASTVRLGFYLSLAVQGSSPDVLRHRPLGYLGRPLCLPDRLPGWGRTSYRSVPGSWFLAGVPRLPE